MRGATEAAKKVKKVFSELRKAHGKAGPPPATDPVSQLLLGVFSRNAPEAKAREALDKLRENVVDYNELRVIPASELTAEIAGLADAGRKCEDVSRALNHIFAIEHDVSLDRVKGLSRKDQVAYLDAVPGIEAYTRARIRLLGFDAHAIPLDEAMWAFCLKYGLVDEKATLEEAQTFLERQIAESDGFEFVALVKRQAWNDFAAVVKKGQAPRIESTAPDRKLTNMLQSVASGNDPYTAMEIPGFEVDGDVEPEFLDEAPKKKKGKSAGGKAPAPLPVEKSTDGKARKSRKSAGKASGAPIAVDAAPAKGGADQPKRAAKGRGKSRAGSS